MTAHQLEDQSELSYVPFDSPAICLKTSIFIVLKVSHWKADQVFFLRATLEPPFDIPIEGFKSCSVSLFCATNLGIPSFPFRASLT